MSLKIKVSNKQFILANCIFIITVVTYFILSVPMGITIVPLGLLVIVEYFVLLFLLNRHEKTDQKLFDNEEVN